jgi:hypothetical protein
MKRSCALFPLLVSIAIGALACKGSSSSTDDRAGACREESLEARNQVSVVIDLTDGGDAGVDPDACVENCVGVSPPPDPFTDAASCGPPCMDAAAQYHYEDPRLVGCHESTVSILCTFDILVHLPCDPITP